MTEDVNNSDQQGQCLHCRKVYINNIYPYSYMHLIVYLNTNIYLQRTESITQYIYINKYVIKQSSITEVNLQCHRTTYREILQEYTGCP